MKTLTKLLPLLFLALAANAQKPTGPPPAEVWQQFTVKEQGRYKYGYKDASGHIRIPAKFGNFTNTESFRHIMAVDESATSKQYYLLKNGHKVGRDSVYMFDATFDCESEGKIRFQDTKRNKVGFFDSRGRVTIPAVYSAAEPFYNGLAVALLGATRICQDGEDTLHCEHLDWIGGKTVLINERNDILLDNLPDSDWTSYNWFSVKVNEVNPDTATTVTYRGVNGDRYTFTEYQKEFKHWLYTTFLPAVRTGQAGAFAPLCYVELAVATPTSDGWPHFKRDAFVQKYYRAALLPNLSTIEPGAKSVDISTEDLNTLIFPGKNFQPFRTACGEHFRRKYPTFDVMITYEATTAPKRKEHQEHFEFIRTAEGYRLYCVSL